MAKLPPPFNRVYEYTNRSMLQFAKAISPYLKKLGFIDELPPIPPFPPDPNTYGAYDNYTEVSISSSQILNMGSTPIVLLPSSNSGVNRYYDYRFIIEFTVGTVSYTTLSSGTYQVKYFSGASVPANYGAGMLNSGPTAPNSVLIFTGTSSSSPGSSASFINILSSVSTTRCQSVLFTTNNGLNPTTGNGTALVKIWYNIINVG